MKYQRTSSISTPLDPLDRAKSIDAFKWGWFERRGYQPHSGQMPIHLSNARYRTGIAGTRGGKSRMNGEEATVYALVGATRIWLVGNTYNDTEKEFRYIWDAFHSEAFYETFGSPNDVLIKDVNNKDGGNMHILSAWGSEVQCVSLQNASIPPLGEECDLIVLCEPANIKNPKQIYERYLHGRLANRMGDVIISGTPAGKAPKNDPDSWLYNLYMKGLVGTDEYDPNYFTNIWSSWENPAFKDDPYWIRSWMNPLIFAEQYEGQFIMISGSVFDAFSPLIHIIKPFKIPQYWNRYEAIDPGYSGMFYWCASVMGEDGVLYIVDEYYDSEKRYIDRANAIWQKRLSAYNLPFVPFREPSQNTNADTWRKAQDNNLAPSINALYIDPEDPQFIVEFAQYGLSGVRANNDVHIGINKVNQKLNKDFVKLYFTSNVPVMTEAMQYHSWGEKTSSDIRKPANDKYKHPADALRYINMGGLSTSENGKEMQSKEGEEEALDMIMGYMTKSRNEYVRDPYQRRMINGC
jgi:hypothetical protein